MCKIEYPRLNYPYYEEYQLPLSKNIDWAKVQKLKEELAGIREEETKRLQRKRKRIDSA